ncbi:colipase isoform X2 [Coturnix japonica]|uniref:colipase isoform X2 n=1 Tax=Coturnix japonica TaxID=93934 RepID=UPI0013A5EE50|nr:colipase isoform X2 [Coturnix japonica]
MCPPPGRAQRPQNEPRSDESLSGDIGELCVQSAQCKSGCCQRDTGLSLARCSQKAAETQGCSRKSLYGVYYKCPCESGLSCDADWSIVGSITNTDYGICYDKRDSASR